MLSILAAAGLTAVDAAAVTITSDSGRRSLSRNFAAPPRTSIRRRLRATVAVTVEVTLPSRSDADLAEAALVDAMSDPSTASSSLAMKVEEVLEEPEATSRFNKAPSLPPLSPSPLPPPPPSPPPPSPPPPSPPPPSPPPPSPTAHDSAAFDHRPHPLRRLATPASPFASATLAAST